MTSAIHLVLDGWTSPLISSYLGLVVVWCTNGKIHRAVLEFIRYGLNIVIISYIILKIFLRLTDSHTGEYLAKVTADCLKHFNLDKKVCLSIYF